MASRAGGRRGRGGRDSRAGREHREPSSRNDDNPTHFLSSFSPSAESDAAISSRTARAGLGSQARTAAAPSSSSPCFNRHRDSIALQGHVPAFLQSVIQANPALLRQLPPSIANGVGRAVGKEGEEDDEDDEAAAKRRAMRDQAEWEKRAAEEGEERPVRDDELPVVANLSEYAGQEAAVSALLGRTAAAPGEEGVAGEEKTVEQSAIASGAVPSHTFHRSKHRLGGEAAAEPETVKKIKVKASGSAGSGGAASGAAKHKTGVGLSFDEADM